MARHYGTIQGNRGRATRCGSKDSGMVAYAASYAGAIRAESFTTRADADHLRVTRDTWSHSGGAVVCLYEGPALFPDRREWTATGEKIEAPAYAAHLGAYVLPDESADTLRAVAAALLARADEMDGGTE